MPLRHCAGCGRELPVRGWWCSEQCRRAEDGDDHPDDPIDNDQIGSL